MILNSTQLLVAPKKVHEILNNPHCKLKKKIDMSESIQDGITVSRRPFSKKKWREQKYSCKAKVEKWDKFRRQQIQREYNKEFKSKKNFKPENKKLKSVAKNSHNNFKQAQIQCTKIQQINEEKQKEQERIRKEKVEAIKAYKEKKAERFKKISQKTRKGQPLMRGRIELLLEKIQKQYVDQDSRINLLKA